MSNLMDKIQDDYRDFCDKEYIFYLENNNKINLKCKRENLPHLIGLHKLKSDYNVIRQMLDKNDYNITPKNIFEILKQNNITYDNFKGCASWTTHIESRMENFTFEKINSILRKTTMFSFIYDEKKTKNKKAKYVLIEKKDLLFLQLYMGYDEKAKSYYPNSYVPSEKRDLNLSRDTLKIVKTEIYSLSENGREIIEVIEHAKKRKISEEIKQLVKVYNSENNKLYKLLNQTDSTEDMLNEVNNLAKQVIIKYNEFKNYISEDEVINKKEYAGLKMFLDSIK